jgi:hypothetical protein
MIESAGFFPKRSSHTFIAMEKLGFGLGSLQPENLLIKSY